MKKYADKACTDTLACTRHMQPRVHIAMPTGTMWYPLFVHKEVVVVLSIWIACYLIYMLYVHHLMYVFLFCVLRTTPRPLHTKLHCWPYVSVHLKLRVCVVFTFFCGLLHTYVYILRSIDFMFMHYNRFICN